MSNSNSVANGAVKEVYGSFFLNGNEFAVSARYIQEVVNAPSVYTNVPLAPAYVKGLLNLRGSVIPIIDICLLLGIESVSQEEPQKVAILVLDGQNVGILLDMTGEVFRSSDDEKSELDQMSASEVISAVFKRENGRRLVQILKVEKLFKLRSVEKKINGLQNRDLRTQANLKRGPKHQCISFTVGPAKCALPINDFQEILKVDAVEASPLESEICLGMVNLRGRSVPIIDFAAVLNCKESTFDPQASLSEKRIIVLKVNGEVFSLAVDSIDSIISYYSDEMIFFSMMEQQKEDLFLGCLTANQVDILLLDSQKIFSSSAIANLAVGHRSLFKKDDDLFTTSLKKATTRSTYILFKSEKLYGFLIQDVGEIINVPLELLKPPKLKPYVLGLYNLRSQMISVLDMRQIYGREPLAQGAENRRVIVLRHGDSQFGLVVDSVESIRTIANNESTQFPDMIYDGSRESSDVKQAFRVVNQSGQNEDIVILKTEGIFNRFMQGDISVDLTSGIRRSA